MLTSTFTRSTLAVATMLAVPMALSAQQMDNQSLQAIDFEARAGVGMAAGDLEPFAKPGLHLGAGVGWWFNDHVALRGNADYSALEGDEETVPTPALAPGLNVLQYGLGLQFDVLGRDMVTNPWSVEVNAGAGGTTLDTDDFIEDGSDMTDLTRTYPNVNAGAEIGRSITENFRVSLAGQMFYSFIDSDEMTELAETRPDEGPIDAGIVVPLTLNIRWDLPMRSVTGN